MTRAPFAVERLAARTAVVGWCLLAGLVVSGLVVPGYGYGNKTAPYHALPASAHPTRLVIASLHIDAPLVPIEITPGGALDPPRDYHLVGWWSGSATPGADHGQTVLTGHTVHTGGGVMDDLGKIKHGARIKIVTPKGTMVYQERRKKTYTREELAKHARYLFNQKRTPVRLVLITCTGWTGTDYTSNEVVFAAPIGAIPAGEHRRAHPTQPSSERTTRRPTDSRARSPVSSAQMSSNWAVARSTSP